ncbi:MAG: GerMN domain-containing protein [Treponema sp.]|nr:GerMN domain-containing protein [Treponema sp.]
MAVRKDPGGKAGGQTGKKTPGKKKKPGGLSVAIIFWLAFFIIIAGFFFINRETIRKNLDILARRLNLPRLALPKEAAGDTAEPAETREEPAPGDGGNGPSPAGGPSLPAPPPQAEPATPPSDSTPAKSGAEENTPPAAAQPAPPPRAAPGGSSAEKSVPPPETKPAAQSAQPARPAKPAETRERNVYFTQVDKDGTILRTRVSRKIAASDSPMLDSLNALLFGPTTEEQRRGLMSLIPKGTRILSATVRGGTAYISFSEDFQYNTYGVEGYAAQLKQIVWTVTEFPNVEDVQILIEGRRVDYLGEGIWIGSPINRDSI